MTRGYASVFKGFRTSTPGGLHKADIMRRPVKRRGGSTTYRYISRARHLAAKKQMKKYGLPEEFLAHTFRKRRSRHSSRRTSRSLRRMRRGRKSRSRR